MHPFPNEEAISSELKGSLEPQFDYAGRMFFHWITAEKDQFLRQSKLPSHVLDVSMLLNIQMMRLFRAVVEDCARGEAFCASIVSRSLFETVLALRFVLKPRVVLFVEPVLDRGTGSQLVDVEGDPKYTAKVRSATSPKGSRRYLSRSTRAWLYICHTCFDDLNFARKCLQTDGLKRIGRKRLTPELTALVSEAKSKLSPEWISVLKRSSSYSGLKVHDLALVLGPQFVRWYQTIYHTQSRVVHATDAIQHAGEYLGMASIEPRYLSSNGEVLGTLQTGTAMFLIGMHLLQENIGFGVLNETAIEGLTKEFLTCFRN